MGGTVWNHEQHGSKVRSTLFGGEVLDGRQLTMEIDTGMSVSLSSAKICHSLFPDVTLQASTTTLCTNSGEPIPVLGQIAVEVSYQGQRAKLNLIVMKGDSPNLLRRNWLSEIRLNRMSIHALGVELQPVSLITTVHCLLQS